VLLTDGVCAVVVTYYPDADVVQNLTILRSQVDRLVVVDNASPRPAVEELRALSISLSFQLIENSRNLGLAAALNQGVTATANCAWVILFDQDSRITGRFMESMLACANSYSAEERVAIVVPRYIDMRFGHVLPPVLAPDGSLAVAMTSGSLLRTSLFPRTGLFEDLFIYQIDYEYCLRIRRMGFSIRECPQAVLHHSPANPKPFRMFGRRLFYTANYKPLTRYYMQRNAAWVRRKYRADFPEYFKGGYKSTWKELFKILVGEEAKLKKIAAMTLGAYDGSRGMMDGRPSLQARDGK
jgi:rhamnosyltransferase